jgi:hypothetical protein
MNASLSDMAYVSPPWRRPECVVFAPCDGITGFPRPLHPRRYHIISACEHRMSCRTRKVGALSRQGERRAHFTRDARFSERDNGRRADLRHIAINFDRPDGYQLRGFNHPRSHPIEFKLKDCHCHSSLATLDGPHSTPNEPTRPRWLRRIGSPRLQTSVTINVG